MSRTWRFALAVLALGAALVIAACGGDDDGLEEGGDEGGEVETAAAKPIGGEQCGHSRRDHRLLRARLGAAAS